MSEIIKQIPDEVQLHVAENEGMFQTREVVEKKDDIWMIQDIKYQLFQEQTSEWEGMRKNYGI